MSALEPNVLNIVDIAYITRCEKMKHDAIETNRVLVTYPLRWKKRILEKAHSVTASGNKPNEQDVWRWAMAIALFPEECTIEKKAQK
jgi:hypothetical protein